MMREKYKILHIEDVQTDAELVARELKKSDFEFLLKVVDSKADYVAALEHFSPDVILCDHSLPSFNSLEALKIARSQNLQIPFVLITATMSEDVAISIIRTGADDYILKDRLNRLPIAIQNGIEKYRYEKERRNYLEKLSANEKRFRALVESGVDAIVILDVKGKATYSSPSVPRMLGYTEAEIKELGVYELLHPDDRKGVATKMEECLQKPGVAIEGYTSRVKHKDGSWRWMEATLTNMLHDPAINGIVDNFRDVTEEIIAAQGTIDNEAFTAGLLDSLSSNIAVVNAAGTIIKVNKSWNTFALDNNASSLEKCSVGANYFDVCSNTIGVGDDVPLLAMDGIKKVLSGATNDFYLEYPCHSPLEERWFYMRVKRFDSSEPLALIEHQYITERKKAELKVIETAQELKRTLNDVDKIMNSSLDVICSIDEDGKFVRLSAATERIWGYKAHELVGVKFMDLVYEEDKEKTNLVAADIISGIPVTMFENRYIHKNGTLVPVLWSASYDEDDKLMIGIAKDATEKKILERTVEAEKQRFQNIFMQAPSCMGSLTGPNHVYESANPLYLELIGKQDIIGKQVTEVLPEIIEQGFIDILDNVFKTGETFIGKESPITFYHNDRQVQKFLNFIYQANKDITGKVAGIFFFAIDVTEQVQSRKKIEESEKKYRQIVETAQEGIWLVDEHDKTIFVNSKLCDILGYDEAEILGKEIFYFIDTESQRLAEKAMENKRKGNTGQGDIKYITKAGEKITANVSANPIFNDDGKYIGALAMVTDITEKVKLQKELQEEQFRSQHELMKAVVDAQEKERAGIGAELHDNVNQLLATSRLYINICLSRPGNQKESLLKSQEYISEAIEELRRLSHALVGPTQDRIMGLVPSIQDLILDISNTKNITVDFRHSTFREERNEVGLKLVVYRIVQEQINNILKHANASEIKIELKKEGKDLVVIIKDNGKGFDTSIQRRGIGLQNINNRAKLYDGTVQLISSPGRGCEMIIAFKDHAFGIIKNAV
ncbi:MAG TPA: PAS domain S-box protein [Segetibacter sp.]|jgi:PAS domain S-box-containing protein